MPHSSYKYFSASGSLSLKKIYRMAVTEVIGKSKEITLKFEIFLSIFNTDITQTKTLVC